MIGLAQHIERLLIENDCVIIPDFGGFVAYNNHSERDADDHLFLPPSRTIGFNPQLKINDGILIQSYMLSHETDFADACAKVEADVQCLINALEEKGEVELPQIGILQYNLEHSYDFIPYNDKITSPKLYGLEAFQMVELADLIKTNEVKTLIKSTPNANPKTYSINVNRAFIRYATTVAAAILLFFFLSTPIENTHISKGSYANLLPVDIFETIESTSIIKNELTHPSTVIDELTPEVSINEEETIATIDEESIETIETSSTIQPVIEDIKKPFHIIVSSSIGKKKAEELVNQLHSKGYNQASIIFNGEKIRVSIMSFSSRNDATKELSLIRDIESFNDAWLLKE